MRSEEFKSKGNAFFAEDKYPEAIDAYTKAINLDVDNHVLYSNRSVAYAGMEVRIH